MRRLGRIARWILGIGIFIIAFAVLYVVYNQQNDEQRQLNESISIAQEALAMTISQKEEQASKLTQLESDLQQQLDKELDELGSTLDERNKELDDWNDEIAELEDKLQEATLQLYNTQADWPISVESIEYDEELFAIADGWDLDINTLSASEPSFKEVEDITYSVTTFVIQVQGEPPENTIYTVHGIKEHILGTVDDILGFINEIATTEDFIRTSIELVDLTVPEALIDAEDEELIASATIELQIYSYKVNDDG